MVFLEGRQALLAHCSQLFQLANGARNQKSGLLLRCQSTAA